MRASTQTDRHIHTLTENTIQGYPRKTTQCHHQKAAGDQQPIDSNLKDGLNPGVLIEVPVFSLPALCITASWNSGSARMNTGPLGNSACCPQRKTVSIKRSLSLLLLLLKGQQVLVTLPISTIFKMQKNEVQNLT